MIHLPALLTILLLVVTRLGAWLAGLIAPALGVSSTAVLVTLHHLLFLGLALPAALLSLARKPHTPAEPDDWAVLGTMRGQAAAANLLWWLIALPAGAWVAWALLSNIVRGGVLDPGLLTVVLAAALGLIATAWPKALHTHDWPPPLDPRPAAPDEPPAPSDPDARPVTFGFSFRPNGRNVQTLAITVPISASRVAEFAQREHPTAGDHGVDASVLARYVTEGMTPEVHAAAVELGRLADRQNLPYLEAVNLVLAFVQSGITYISDEEARGMAEHYSYPIETLHAKKGDCEDHSILAAAIYRSLAINALLIYVHRTDHDSDHIAVGVEAKLALEGVHYVEHNGTKFFYGETTGEGWRLGNVPPESRGGRLSPIPV